MSSREQSRERQYQDSHPMSSSSPSSPLFPIALPRWIRQNRPRSTALSNGRVKIILVGLSCILLGWTLTSVLGPNEEGQLVWDPSYDLASGGVLEYPTGSGQNPALSASIRQPGIIGDSAPGDEVELADDDDLDKRPSVAGALSELHNAVKDKLHSWNPYFVRPSGSRNGTFNDKAKGHNAATAFIAGESITDGISESERLGARIRIGKCTILFNGNSFWERAIRTHERHDREHGYRLHVLRQHLMDDVWSKPAYILSLLLRELAKPDSERLDWLFWVDADTVLLNPYIPIDVFLPPPGPEFDDINLVYSNDWNGLNNGVFPIRVGPWAVELFAGIVAYRHFRPTDPLQFRDQSAMDTLMREIGGGKHVVRAPQRWFNAYQGEHNETLAPFQIRRGDFLVHFAGVPDREARMDVWLQRAEQHLDDWEVPLKSTSYPQEARDFWNEQRGLRQQQKEELARVRLTAKELIEQVAKKLSDYGDRLSEAQRESINQQKEGLEVVLNNGNRDSDTILIQAESGKLDDIAEPLNAAMSEAHKLLLNSAHGAIFAGEKDLLAAGFRDGLTDPELEKISYAIVQLKALVMTPQEKWDRLQITSATNEVTEARAKLQEKNDKFAAERKKAELEKEAAQKEMAELQKQVQVEAGIVVSEDVAAPAILTSAAAGEEREQATSRMLEVAEGSPSLGVPRYAISSSMGTSAAS